MVQLSDLNGPGGARIRLDACFRRLIAIQGEAEELQQRAKFLPQETAAQQGMMLAAHERMATRQALLAIMDSLACLMDDRFPEEIKAAIARHAAQQEAAKAANGKAAGKLELVQ